MTWITKALDRSLYIQVKLIIHFLSTGLQDYVKRNIINKLIMNKYNVLIKNIMQLFHLYNYEHTLDGSLSMQL